MGYRHFGYWPLAVGQQRVQEVQGFKKFKNFGYWLLAVGS